MFTCGVADYDYILPADCLVLFDAKKMYILRVLFHNRLATIVVHK